MQELIFWAIFLTVALALVFTQYSLQSSQVIRQPELRQLNELLPDPTKTDPELELVYENTVTLAKLTEVLGKKDILLGLGSSSGPDLRQAYVRESARQVALQELIKKLELKQAGLEARLPEELKQPLREIFESLYGSLTTEEDALVSTVRIWKKVNGEIVTYHFLLAFDDEYALAFVKQRRAEAVEKIERGSLNDFTRLWRETFALQSQSK